MTPRQFKLALKRIGLTQVGASKFFGTNDRTVRRWIAGGTIPRSIILLLRIMTAHGWTAEEVDEG